MLCRSFNRLWILIIFLCVLASAGVAEVIETTIYTSFTLAMKPGHTVGDIAYSPTSNTLLIVPFEYIYEGDPPYYREYSTSGTLIQTVDLPYVHLGEPDNLVDSPINSIEVDWLDNSIWLAQVGQLRTGMYPPSYSVYIIRMTSIQDIQHKLEDSAEEINDTHCVIALNPIAQEIWISPDQNPNRRTYDGTYIYKRYGFFLDTLSITYDPTEDVLYNMNDAGGTVRRYTKDFDFLGDFDLTAPLGNCRGIAHKSGNLFWVANENTAYLIEIPDGASVDDWRLY